MKNTIQINERLRVVDKDKDNYALERRNEEPSKGEKSLGEYRWTPIAFGHSAKSMEHVVMRELVSIAQDAARAKAIKDWGSNLASANIALLADKKDKPK